MTFYEYSESMKNRLESGYVLPSQTHMFMDMETAVLSMNGHKQLVLTTLEYTPEFFGIDYSMHFEARSISSYNNSFEYLSDDIRKYKRNKYAVLLNPLALLLCKYVIFCNAHKSLQRILKSPVKASVSNHHKSACHGFIAVLCIEALNSKPSKIINNSVSSCS